MEWYRRCTCIPRCTAGARTPASASALWRQSGSCAWPRLHELRYATGRPPPSCGASFPFKFLGYPPNRSFLDEKGFLSCSAVCHKVQCRSGCNQKCKSRLMRKSIVTSRLLMSFKQRTAHGSAVMGWVSSSVEERALSSSVLGWVSSSAEERAVSSSVVGCACLTVVWMACIAIAGWA